MDRPWFTEDNKVDFISDGLQCAMRRGPCGSWCGYVAIPSSHPWFGKSYSDKISTVPDMLTNRSPEDHGSISILCAALSGDDIKELISIDLALRVHGGITYEGDHCPMSKPDGNWWFGFDCAHAGDLIPSFYEQRGGCGSDTYRDQSYVVSECQSLAAQLVKIGA